MAKAVVGHGETRGQAPPRQDADGDLVAKLPQAAPGMRVTLPRALSKLGHCSRTQAEKLVAGGHVKVDGRIVTDLSAWVDIRTDRIEVDGKTLHRVRMGPYTGEQAAAKAKRALAEQGIATVRVKLP